VANWVRLNASWVQEANYQGLWWKSPAYSESGWGVNITHQGDTLFATWFTYAPDGTGSWFVMSNGTKTGDATYRGALARTTGSPVNALWNQSQFQGTEVGSATFTFTDSRKGVFSYVVNGITETKAITQFQFSEQVPACIKGASHLASPNYQGIWWNSPAESESGWGVNVAHQGDTLFVTWFTYAADRSAAWFVMDNARKTADGVYQGKLYRTVGTPLGTAWNNDRYHSTEVGSATFTFTDPNTGSFASTVDGVSQVKSITRYVYAQPETVCR
jgi:hypothetical protein